MHAYVKQNLYTEMQGYLLALVLSLLLQAPVNVCGSMENCRVWTSRQGLDRCLQRRPAGSISRSDHDMATRHLVALVLKERRKMMTKKHHSQSGTAEDE